MQPYYVMMEMGCLLTLKGKKNQRKDVLPKIIALEY